MLQKFSVTCDIRGFMGSMCDVASPPPLALCPLVTKKKRSFFATPTLSKLVERRAISNQDEPVFDEWIKNNEDKVRVGPAVFGGGSFLLVLLNRTLSGIAPVADASSAQSRADVLALVLAATVVLTGLVWMSIKPKKITTVQLLGVECLRFGKELPLKVAEELLWSWEALRDATCCRGLVILYRGHCVLQVGLAAQASRGGPEAAAVNASSLVKGSLCRAVLESGKQSYLANLSLYPSRFELDFLPSNTQAVILQPLGNEGVLILAGDTIRGFGPADQGWISSIGEKLDATLGKCAFP